LQPKSFWRTLLKTHKPIFYLTIFFALFFATKTIYKNNLNSPTKRIVYVDMVADLFHTGHIAFLKQAREKGDYLIVGLMSDESCASYKRTPVLTLEERTIMLESCKYIDKVIPDSPLQIPDEFLDAHKIDVVVHGDDFDTEELKFFYKIPIKRGIFKTVPYTKGISTTDIIERIKSRY